MSTIFFRLLDTAPDGKAESLARAAADAHSGDLRNVAGGVADPVGFSRVPGSPFAYWVGEHVRRLFQDLALFEGQGRTVKQGLATSDDGRFLRAWWEVGASRALSGSLGPSADVKALQTRCRAQTELGKRWVPFAKGGEYSPYYSDIFLVVNWEQDGEEIKCFATTRPGTTHWSRRVASYPYYFLPGLTWSRRTQGGFSVRALPAGCIFADKGPAAFASEHSLGALLALMNSSAFIGLVSLQMTFGSYEVGVIQRTPLPALDGPGGRELGEFALSAAIDKADLDRPNEISHVFHVPALLQESALTLSGRVATWQDDMARATQVLEAYQWEIDEIAFRLYGIDGEDRQAIEDELKRRPAKGENAGGDDDVDGDEDDGGEEEVVAGSDAHSLVAALVSYLAGCAFGRWDVRFATGERAAPELPDPFAPLPVCSPGMLQGDDGMPLLTPPAGYPLAIAENGILVDDAGHPDDIVRRLQAVCELVFGERAEAMTREACEILGVRELRDWFRNPRAFWDEHVKRYSKSRRKAPIYWLLQSSKRSYGLWLYYHRLDADLPAKALTQYVEPRVRQEQAKFDALQADRQQSGAIGAAARQLERQIERHEALISELHDFRAKLERVVGLGLRPDLDDGVLLNIAPLHELVPWKPAKDAWQELLAGKYAWSTIGAQLREKGLVR